MGVEGEDRRMIIANGVNASASAGVGEMKRA